MIKQKIPVKSEVLAALGTIKETINNFDEHSKFLSSKNIITDNNKLGALVSHTTFHIWIHTSFTNIFSQYSTTKEQVLFLITRVEDFCSDLQEKDIKRLTTKFATKQGIGYKVEHAKAYIWLIMFLTK